MLVYITKMSGTLLEAAGYLGTGPHKAVAEELLENGAQMLTQIREVLEAHRDDLHTSQPLDRLTAIEGAWQAQTVGLEGQLEEFIECLPKEISYQVRAVFFTGLGSTWDAMESVYEYMRDDPRFDPVVVLIPVFRQVEKNGELKRDVIYQDYLTPLGIPFYEYTKYHIEDDLPDLAFTNQPYESVVLPEFWPENIAKHTRLVYLSYYLPDVVEQSTQITLAQLPVYRFAWKIVCPTEKQFKFYCRYAANQGANALLTGLPKTDLLVVPKGRNIPTPEGWEKLRGKTIFLWNSWYDAKGASLRFFHELLEWFVEHKNCGLIWRPHPMTDTVTKLHYPEHYPTYQAYIRNARAAKNVVLDTETSCLAAFSISNAMISDYSSLLPQYLLLDKPALRIDSPVFHFTGEEFIESSWMERAETIDDVYAFMERIRRGEDRKAALRKTIRERDLSLADGHCGKRVCEAVWVCLHQEDLER